MLRIETVKDKLSRFDLKNKLPQVIGGVLLLLGLIVVFLTYKDYTLAYLKFSFSNKDVSKIEVVVEGKEVEEDNGNDKEIVLVDNQYGIYIPKIEANAKVIPNVNAYREDEYTSALTKGVAHANGTALPNEGGNTFLFAHSAVNFYESRKFNVHFYLLNKLEESDEVYVSYKGELYKYTVTEVKIVEPTDIKYLGRYEDRETVTLMTCWPAGFNYKRVIVIADRVEE